MAVPSSDIRNIVLAGHGHSGKTTLTESMLYISEGVQRFGKVDEGHSASDYDPNEIKRKISINTTIAPISWKNKKINILDTPGYADFIGEVISALAATDNLILVVDSVSGVQIQSEHIWNMAEEKNIPRAVFINKLDKEHSDFENTLTEISNTFKGNVTALFLPVGKETQFKGIVDITSGKAYQFNDKDTEEIEIPQDMKAEVDNRREKLIEAAAEADDSLLEKYLESGELSAEEVSQGLINGIKKGETIPVFCGSALSNTGISVLMDSIVNLMPSPADMPEKVGLDDKKAGESFSGLVFKTMTDPYVGRLNFVRIFSGSLKTDSAIYNSTKDSKSKVSHIFQSKGKENKDVSDAASGDIVTIPKLEGVETGDTLCLESNKIIYKPIKFPDSVLSFSIAPKTKGDEEKISTGLHKIIEEDTTLNIKRDPETHETIISGIGDVQLEVLTDKLKDKFGVETVLKEPKIPYRETIQGTSEAEGKYKKQTGGKGQYGDVWLRLESLPRGQQYEFVNAIKGGVVPTGFIPAVQKGLNEVMESGVLAGYPVVDVKVTLYDGSYHPVDSSEMAFKIAASMGFKNAFMNAKPIMLEPVVDIEAIVPEKFMGDVIGDISSKRGKVHGMESVGKNQLVKAQVPLAEVARYAIELRSLTHGEGSFSMKFSHYEEVPPDASKKIIEQHEKEKEES